MRKPIVLIFLLAFLPALLFASNGQKVIPLESYVYSAIDALYILEGKATASTTRPWTVAELKKILSKVSRETSAELYSLVESAVEEEPDVSVDDAFGMSFSGRLSVTGYAHTDTSFTYPFNEMHNNLFRTDHDTSTLRVDWEAWFTDFLYSFVWYQYKNEYNNNGYGKFNFDFDVSNFTPDGFTTNMDQREPSRAFFTVGGNSWSLEYGRDSLSIGKGNSGSLILSDVFPYHHLLRASLFGTRYKYSFILSFLPHLTVNDEKTIVEGGAGALFYMTHRLEFRFFSDRLYVALNESIMYRNDGGPLDLRYFNPVMFFHNYFIPSSANSIVDLEVSYTFAPGWNVYGQFALDQIASPVELVEDEYNEPLAFGAMLGLQNVRLLGKGVLTTALEGAYTMPYLYLRATSISNPSENPSQSETDPGLGYIGSYRGNLFPIGYKYGGDAVVADLKITYEVPSSWSVSGEGLFMVHGENSIRSKFRLDNSFAPSGEAWTFALIELRYRKSLSEKLTVYAQYDFVKAKYSSDNQLTIGAEFRF